MSSDLRLFGGGSDAVVGDTVENAASSGLVAHEIIYLGNDWKKDRCRISDRAVCGGFGEFAVG